MGCCAQPAGKAAILKEVKKVQDFRDLWVTGDKLGEGTFGMVFECTRKNSSDKTVYAVKMMEHQSSWWGKISRSQDAQWQMFAQEYSMLKQMEHPNLIKFIGVYLDDYFVYFIMEKYQTSLIGAVLPILQKKGPKGLPGYIVGEITSQMLCSVAYLHRQKIVHRDVKADNYLTDTTQFKGRRFKIVLTDLSTARYLEDGVYLKDPIGTVNYWAPEMASRSYRHKVDVWAIGVVLWCMLTVKFPFVTVQETFTKKLVPHSGRMTEEQFDLADKMLTKSPARRIGAEEAQQHPWVVASVEKHRRSVARAESKMESVTTEERSDESAAGSSVGSRVPSEDLDVSWGSPKGHVSAEATTRRLNKLHMAKVRHANGEKVALTVEERSPRPDPNVPSFETEGLHVAGRQRKGEAKTYAWWDQTRCIEKNVPDVLTSCERPANAEDAAAGIDVVAEQAGDVILSDPGDTQDLKRCLEAYGIDVSLFGVGQAKTINHLLHELQSHECHLLARGSTIMRVVDLLVLRVASPSGRFLVEVSQSLPDGRDRMVRRLPAVMRRAGSSGFASIAVELSRLLDEELHTTSDVIRFVPVDGAQQELQSSRMASQSYPGLESIYRKCFFNAVINTDAPAKRLAAIGLPGEMPFETHLADGTKVCWEWWDTDKCRNFSLPVNPKPPDVLPEFRGFRMLVHKPKWTEAALLEVLERHHIDVLLFGVGKARSISEFVEEANSGESRLWEKAGELRRCLEVLVVKIRNADGAYLIETGHTFGNGRSRERNAFPATKVRPFEDKVWAVRRLLREVDIPFFANAKIRFGPKRAEEQTSPSYPNILTVYLKQVVEVELNDLDVKNLQDDAAAKWFQGTKEFIPGHELTVM